MIDNILSMYIMVYKLNFMESKMTQELENKLTEKQTDKIRRFCEIVGSRFEGKLSDVNHLSSKFYEKFKWGGEAMIKDSILKEYAILMLQFKTIGDFENLKNICLKNLINGNFRANSSSAASNLVSMYHSEIDGYLVENLENFIYDLKSE